MTGGDWIWMVSVYFAVGLLLNLWMYRAGAFKGTETDAELGGLFICCWLIWPIAGFVIGCAVVFERLGRFLRTHE